MKTGVMVILTMSVAASLTAMAADGHAVERMLKLKTGECEFKLLDSKGVEPLAFSDLTLSSPENGDVVVQATADKRGECVVRLDAGRYILGVNGVNLSIMEVTASSEIAECRIVVPERPMLVGAGEDDDDDDTNVVVVVPATSAGAVTAAGAGGGAGGAAVGGMTYVVVGGAAVLVGGGVAIGEHNDWGSSDRKDSGVTTSAGDEPESKPSGPTSP